MVSTKAFFTGLTAAALYAQTEAGKGPPRPPDCLLDIRLTRPTPRGEPGWEQLVKANIEYHTGKDATGYGYIEGYEWKVTADSNCKLLETFCNHPHQPVKFFSYRRKDVTSIPATVSTRSKMAWKHLKQQVKDYDTKIPWYYR
ncbi:hypothetical protein M0657_004930 [Pyricularia oryzae]|uniref:Uncharacterized protein n=2 Tax=Pyricularia oryzae TaxID=318829 RepID=A0AA97P5A2_PYRO3|nr:hypothetical protein OOU_Y34scaffold00217g32 [Pyricularia oryzae Y34]KAI7923332.1 hypothetical protein M9X92_004434 [Pyricularia oryzae]KAI7923920.1 hypothetical protein M0657_004930 [Pyricularia oryzae]